ncbi:MAG: hypothetical protein MUW56_08075 [Chryseobacterium sp.]|uniref:hypothetical protein n=1 Tax=Chryseobacterium sp. TaxID=1871047 RepID=UPI0025C4250C|nr:hypothetical protein [Chryseobacterium sp.]MCJ7933583.1 hypothetical protein [Chryseobacterium sp.]
MKNIIFLLLTVISCNAKDQNNSSSDTVPLLQESLIKKDTIITYNIDGISSEGSEAVVIYKRKKIYESKINIYGETGQAELIYKFYPTKIEVIEKTHKYKGDLKSVNSKEDLKLVNIVKYYIDYKGELLSNPPKKRIDIFKEFKNNVPFEIK